MDGVPKMKKKRAALSLLLILCFVILLLSFPLVNATEDSWTMLEPMPTARSWFGVAVVDGKIYAIGGTNGTHRLDVNEMYDPATDTWTTKKSMPTARAGLAIAVYQNKIYVIGGIIGDSSPSYSGYTGVNEVYDPLTDTWETMEPMPLARASLDANVVGDKIFLVCGIKYCDVFPFQQDANENQVYDTSNDSWSTKTPMSIRTCSYASAVVDNKIHIMGGPNFGGAFNVYDPETGKWIETFSENPHQIYDAETDTWTSGTSLPKLVGGAAAGATTGLLAPKRIYVFGGNTGSSNIASNLTQVYDPETDTWTNGATMLTSRYSLGVAVVNDELYAIGGHDNETIFSVNEKYTPADYIPEFPSWIVLPLFVVATLVVIAYRKKLHVVT
jgi:N-acetylneuraminic acid mutarotase